MLNPNLNEMLKDRAFVDYFNIYLCQPIFGYGMIYRFNEMEFVVNSRFHEYENLTPQKLQEWLEVERFPGFFRTRFYYEYRMCTMLRKTPLNDLVTYIDWGCDSFKLSIVQLLENMFSSYTGMQLFKLSLMDSGGERVWRCMLDIDDYCNDDTSVQARLDLHNHLRMTYFASGSEFEINESTKLHYFSEKYRNTYHSPESDDSYLSTLSTTAATTDNEHRSSTSMDDNDENQRSNISVDNGKDLSNASINNDDWKQSHTSTDSDKNESNPSMNGCKDESNPSTNGCKNESNPSTNGCKNESNPSTNGSKNQSNISTNNRNITNNSTVVHPVMFDGIGYVQTLFDYTDFLNEPKTALSHLNRILSLTLMNYWNPRFVLDVNAAIKDIHPEAEIHCNYHTEPKGGHGLRPFNIDATMDTIWEEVGENEKENRDTSEEDTPQTSSKTDVICPLLEHTAAKPNQLEPLKVNPVVNPLKMKKDISATTRRLLFGNQEIPAYLQTKLSTRIVKILSSDLNSGQPFNRYLVAHKMDTEAKTLALWNTLCKFIKMMSVSNYNYRKFFMSHFASRLIIILMKSETLITSHMTDLIRDGVNTLLIGDSNQHKYTLLETVYEIALLLLKPWKLYRSTNLRIFSDMMNKQGFLFSKKTQFEVRRRIAPQELRPNDILNLQCLSQFCFYTPEVHEVKEPDKLRKLPDITNVGYYIMSKQSKTKRKKMSEPRTPKVFDSKFYHALRPRKISIRDIKVYPMKPLVPAECPSDSLSLSKSEETLLATKDYYKGQKHSGYYDFVKNTRTDRNRYICKRLVRRLCFFIKAMREEKNAIMLAKYASYVSKLKPRSAGSALRSKKSTKRFNIAKFKRRNMARVKPDDVMFLSDVLHYKHVIVQSLKTGQMTENKRLSKNMADRILTKYLAPDQNPMKISVTKSMALQTQMELKREGVTRTLFHDAFLKILPAAYHLWTSLEQFTIEAGGREAAWTELTGEAGYMEGQLTDDADYSSGVKPLIAKIQMKSSFRKRGTRSVLGKRETRLLAEYKKLQRSMYIDRRRRSLEFNSKQQPFPEPLFHIAIPTMETNFLRGLIGVRGGSALDFVLVK